MRWREKLNRFQTDGPNRLLVVSDWDRTLTRATAEDGRDQSTCSVIANSGHLGPAFGRRYRELFDRYRGIERASDIPRHEKLPHLRQWWTRQFDLLLEYKLNVRIIHRIVSEKRPRLREGARRFFCRLHDCGIPLIILSAGIRQIIEARLAAIGVPTANVVIIANVLDFDTKGDAVAYHTPLIHSLNKTGAGAEAFPGRRNLLLLGDTLEDINMAAGIGHESLLSFAFPVDFDHIEDFRSLYDVVITPEASLEPVNAVLNDICAPSRRH